MFYFRFQTKQMEEKAKEERIRKEIAKTVDTSQKASTLSTDTFQSIAQTDSLPSVSVANTGKDLTLSNEFMTVQVNTTGGKIHNVSLKKHTTYEDKPVELLSDKKTSFQFSLPTAKGTIDTKNLPFDVVEHTAQKLVLRSANGLLLTYDLAPNSYVINQHWITSGGMKGGKLNFETQMNRQEVNLSRERQYSTIKYLLQNDDKALSLSTTKNESLEEKNPMKWISYGQQFFNISIIPHSGFTEAKMISEYKETDQDYVKNYSFQANLGEAKDTLSIDYFVGPSDYKLLKKTNTDLDLIVPLSQDILIFRWMKIFNIYLIIPIFDFLSKFFTNYGLIIFLLTLFIKVITAPLSYKTYKSGIAMKILKPELDKLKAKYGDDQTKMSQEQMKLYGEYGVSPFGGCLPMLLQMPILFAMFFFFPASIELRHEHFLWAKDLSTYDSILTLPFNIPLYGSHISLFALLTSLTQIGMSWYSQRLQPSSPQADQMKMMMYIMPLVFLFLFNSFPAALTYYYFLQNVLSMVQQWFFTTFIIKEDKVRAEMELARKTPKKQGAFQKKMSEMMEQAEQQRKLQQNQNKK